MSTRDDLVNMYVWPCIYFHAYYLLTMSQTLVNGHLCTYIKIGYINL